MDKLCFTIGLFAFRSIGETTSADKYRGAADTGITNGAAECLSANIDEQDNGLGAAIKTSAASCY